MYESIIDRHEVENLKLIIQAYTSSVTVYKYV